MENKKRIIKDNMKEEFQMRRVTKKWKTMLTGIAIGVMALSLNVSAQTRSYLFHMNEDYLHGTVANCGYVATKADNEQKAYVTMTQFSVSSGSPKISMWVGPNGRTGQLTTAWTWTSTASTLTLDYYRVTAKAGNQYQLCAEQFGHGSVVVGGRWTP